MFYFIRHGKLHLPYKDHDEIPLKVLADLASLKLNPPIDVKFAEKQVLKLAGAIPFHTLEKIYHSPSRRCRDTARLISKFIFDHYDKNVATVTARGLREIQFDLLKVYFPHNADKSSIASVNDAVFEAMVNTSEYCEYAGSAYERVDILLKSNVAAEPSLFVTHDFIMRVIEIYIKNHGNLHHKITYKELEDTQRNLYLHGFATDFSFNSFLTF